MNIFHKNYLSNNADVAVPCTWNIELLYLRVSKQRLAPYQHPTHTPLFPLSPFYVERPEEASLASLD
jgi:hypothetical protein